MTVSDEAVCRRQAADPLMLEEEEDNVCVQSAVETPQTPETCPETSLSAFWVQELHSKVFAGKLFQVSVSSVQDERCRCCRDFTFVRELFFFSVASRGVNKKRSEICEIRCEIHAKYDVQVVETKRPCLSSCWRTVVDFVPLSHKLTCFGR